MSDLLRLKIEIIVRQLIIGDELSHLLTLDIKKYYIDINCSTNC